MEQYRPRYMLHGHQHLNYGTHPRIQAFQATQVINAFGYYLLDIPSQ